MKFCITKKRIYVGLTVIGAAVLAFAFYVFLFPNFHTASQGKYVTISRGESFHNVVDSLLENGVIRNKWSFKLAGRILGLTKTIKVGKYLFVSGQSNYSILSDISLGKSRLIIPVTIPEGWPLSKIGRRFAKELGIDENRFFALCQDEQFISSSDINAKSLEGYLLPDTYSFYWQTDEKEIIKRILDAFKKFYDDTLFIKQKELGKTQTEILTLASIVEAESNLDEERARIAGVYMNRLKKRMRLEADPTVQYAIGEERRLRYTDLNFNSPYNTYRNYGLPPGPINNPGRLSIIAALYPEKNDFLFFVATGRGGHWFARNYNEHLKNIRLYHRTRRELKKISES
ncbi:MAG: endolytic transglycosylase MltG [Bacteroidetes bacterium]|nr:endolytic transglycosylase MltG [Bacteroidota bacterium]